MIKIKIAFFDIDGTLIDMNAKTISKRMLDTLVRLKDKGMILCLATGRSPITLPDFGEVTFDAFLTFNGSYCYDSERTIFSSHIPAKDVKQLIQNATEIGRPVSVATKDRLAANGADQDLIDYYAKAKLKVEVSDDFEAVLQEDIYQVMTGCRESEYEHMMKDIRHAKITAWWDRAVDIIPEDGGKGKAIEKILEYYNLDQSEAIAFGDGNNDIEMIQSVGTGVAMANGSEQLKAVADDVCGNVAEDGIYYYCLEHELI